MERQNKKLFLLDAYALIYRAFFALNKNPRINSKGVNTSAIMGFLNTLNEILKNEDPSHIAVAFDVSAPTNRQREFLDYKANREKMPEDLRASIPYIVEIIKGYNIPIFAVEGYEADDVIGTLSRQAEKEGFVTYMMTPDKDFGQLVTDKVFMYKPAKLGEPAQVWGPKEVCSRYGIADQKQLIDILGLWGDVSDNIPGIPGIGEKTASALIAQYGSIENLIAHADELKGKQKENIIKFAEQGLMSKKLATININVPVVFDAKGLELQEPDVNRLMTLFDDLEFKVFAKRFIEEQNNKQIVVKPEKVTQGVSQLDLFGREAQGDATITSFSNKNNINTLSHNYMLVDTDVALQKMTTILQMQKGFSFDTETAGIDAFNSDIVGISFAIKAHEAWYVPVSADADAWKRKMDLLKPLFEDAKLLKIGHNLKNGISVLRRYGIAVGGPLFDTMIAHYLIEPDQRHNMDYLAEAYLDYVTVTIESIVGKGHQGITLKSAPLQAVKDFGAESADIVWRLYEQFLPMLQNTGVEKIFYNIEMPLVPVLSIMESNGVKIDSDNLHQISDEFGKEIHDKESKIYSIAEEQFNIGSPRQLGEILFDKLKIKNGGKKTKTGQYATGEDVLQKLSHNNPIIQEILDYRTLTKLKSTYLDALPALVNPRDGLIHTTYNQAVASTGRLSSNNPNLQNIPVRTEQGREIRKAFVPRCEQFTIMSADYSQIELRIIAHLSGDKAMIEDFRLGRDIHAATAAKVYHVPLTEVTKEQRSKSKAVNFGIIYGMSAFGLAERLGISRGEAAGIISKYFDEYQGIKEYMSQSIEFAKKHGYAETILGRRRYLRDINASNSVVRNFAERNAINAPIQGSSADMIKIAMIDINNEMQRLSMQSKMMLQVHDELVFDAHLDEVQQLRAIVEDKMVNAMPLTVPVVVEISTGDNWLEAH